MLTDVCKPEASCIGVLVLQVLGSLRLVVASLVSFIIQFGVWQFVRSCRSVQARLTFLETSISGCSFWLCPWKLEVLNIYTVCMRIVRSSGTFFQLVVSGSLSLPVWCCTGFK